MDELQQLMQFLKTRLPLGSLGAVRPIRTSDEELLMPIELQGLSGSTATMRRASGAGRELARQLCRQLGISVAAIPRSAQRAPLWPAGIVGSISHDSLFAAAVAAPEASFGGLGIDIEPRELLPQGLGPLIATAAELMDFREIAFGEKALFSVKEAVFKAVHPRDQVFLEFDDLIVDRRSSTATTCYGRSVNWRLTIEPRILAVAWW